MITRQPDYWFTFEYSNHYESMRRDIQCCGQYTQCGRQTKRNWTKAHRHICSFVPICTHTHTPVLHFGCPLPISKCADRLISPVAVVAQKFSGPGPTVRVCGCATHQGGSRNLTKGVKSGVWRMVEFTLPQKWDEGLAQNWGPASLAQPKLSLDIDRRCCSCTSL